MSRFLSPKDLYELFVSKGFEIYPPKFFPGSQDFILSEGAQLKEAITPIAMESFGKDGRTINYISIRTVVELGL